MACFFTMNTGVQRMPLVAGEETWQGIFSPFSSGLGAWVGLKSMSF